jgi:hypothetical protein
MNVQGLVTLQRVDSALQRLANRRTRLSEHDDVHAAEMAIAGLASLAATHEAMSSQASASIDEIERQGHELDTKKARLEAQLKTVIAPREAEALMHEIEIIDARHGELDDIELAAMEQQESATAELASVRQQIPGAEARLDAARRALQVAQSVIDDQAAELDDQRAQAVAALTTDELQWYEQQRAAHQGIGVAELDGSHCSGCHLDLSRAELEAVKRTAPDQFAECPQCNRPLAR